MIITDDFVVLNNPKTGSSFVRSVMHALHVRRMRRRSLAVRALHRTGLRSRPTFIELILPNIRESPARPDDQHGTFSQIPVEHRHKPIVSVVRNPYDRFLSEYEFRWWTKYPAFPVEVLQREFPHYPDLSLDDFVRLQEMKRHRKRNPHLRPGMELGGQTFNFIKMFFKDPDAAFRRLDDRYIESGQFVEDMGPIQFLRTENLNEELATFLRRYGYPEEDLAFVREHDRVNATRNTSQSRDLLWTEKTLRSVQERESFLFRILAHFGFEYAPPSVSLGGASRGAD
jgi:hypothetical protein